VRVLGVDPGLAVTGYGVVESDGVRFAIVEAGVVRSSDKHSFPERVRTIADGISTVISEHTPESVAVESLHVKYRHPRTAVIMGHARGGVLLEAARRGLSVSDYAPSRIKNAVCGSGSASKEQVARAVASRLGLLQPPEPPDVTDALAVALCHLQSLSGMR
jgi:crossover junction endodeoxyribonuclease RuvC